MFVELILSLALVILIWNITKKPVNLPPGFWGLPLIGYIPLDGKPILERVRTARKTMGDIILWRMGIRNVIFLFDFATIKKLFSMTELSGRPDMFVLNIFDPKTKLGLLGSSGSSSHEARKFALRQLRDLGMGKSKMIQSIQEEAVSLVDEMKKVAGSPGPLPRALSITLLNVSWKLITNKRYEIDDPSLQRFEELFQQLQQMIPSISVLDYLPWLRYVLPNSFIYYFFMGSGEKAKEELTAFFTKIIEEHKQTLDENNPRDYIDAYLIEMKNTPKDSQYVMSDTDLLSCVGDLYLAGSETGVATMQWILFSIAAYPKVQQRLQEEVDRVLPKGTLPSLENQTELHYSKAVIHEVHRCRSFLPTGLPRRAIKDITVDGYLIPKDATVVAVATSCQEDPKYWKDPMEFNPERHIDPNGKFMSPKEGYLPFGIGKRVCVGETIAKIELLIFLTTIVQSISILPPPTNPVNLTPGVFNAIVRIAVEDQHVLLLERS